MINLIDQEEFGISNVQKCAANKQIKSLKTTMIIIAQKGLECKNEKATSH